jgi:hypothetical protein
MQVRVTRAGDGFAARVTGADDLGRLSVGLEPGIDWRAANGGLAGAVRLESDAQAWIDEAWLRRAGGFDAGPRAARFSEMVEYARRHGWVDAATGAIAAHVERLEAAA